MAFTEERPNERGLATCMFFTSVHHRLSVASRFTTTTPIYYADLLPYKKRWPVTFGKLIRADQSQLSKSLPVVP